MVYNQARMFVPTLYLLRFASALYNVSWYRSAAASASLVSLLAKGLRKSTLLVNNWLNSEFDTVSMFNS